MAEFARAQVRDLMKRFRAGDRDAFTEIYRDHHSAVFRFALLMTGDGMKAAEVTQDVFVWLIHHSVEFDPSRGELSAFLIGVARKFLKRRYAEEQRWMALDENIAGPNVLPDTEVARLRQAIAALPQRYREVVVLCDLEGKTYEEAAMMAHCVVGTIRSRLHRARALLARKMTGKECPV